MTERRASPLWRTATPAAVVAILCAAAILAEPAPVRGLKNTGIDAVSQVQAPAANPSVTVGDIDAAAVRAIGDWPWPRARLAALVSAIAAGKPSAIALDMVLSGRCGAVDPGNADLAAAIARAPVTLGFVLSDQPGAVPASSPVALRQPLDFLGLWQSPGAETPCPEFAKAAEGLSGISSPFSRSYCGAGCG